MFYDFLDGLTDQYLKSIGRKRREVKGTFSLVEGVDFKTKLDLGEAFLTEDEAYVLDDHDNKNPVYFYKKSYFFFYKPGVRGDPKFHIRKCSTVRAFGQGEYLASNTKEVTIQNKNWKNGERTYTLTLKICQNCCHEIMDPAQTTEEFHERLQRDYEEQRRLNQPVKVDLDGYTLDWPLISRQYKKTMNYTCESCGIHLEYDRRFMHLHHKNGDKTDNRPQNLACLCILCHSCQNEHHFNRFQKGRMKKELEQFIRNYESELRNVGNPYLSQLPV